MRPPGLPDGSPRLLLRRPLGLEDPPALSPSEMDRAARAIAARPDYRPTPLRDMPGLARHLGLGAVLCKDESHRFGRGGVKALGAPHALQSLHAGPGVTAVAATDGNHGLALAWAAAAQGARAVIFISRDAAPARLAHLRAAGAEVRPVAGTYDDAVLAAAVFAQQASGRLLVSDTDYVGDDPATRLVLAGYTLLGREIAAALGPRRPSHVVLQCGVGGMAAGVLLGLRAAWGKLEARVVLVEPLRAAGVMASLEAGQDVEVRGDLATRMAGLACGRPSRPAFRVLAAEAHAAIAIGDIVAEEVQASLVLGRWGDPPLATGDTGMAGLAGLVAAVRSGLSERLALGLTSTVLTVNSEGPVEEA